MNATDAWNTWKKGFFAWENATADLLEQWLRSPMLLGPSGAMLSALFRAKAKGEQAAADWWSQVGLSNRRDQERALHLINQLHTRINDLEEQLDDLRRPAQVPAPPTPPSEDTAESG